MGFKFTCPHCNAALNVTEPAFGKTIPCPGCKQPIKVPQPPPSRQASRVPAPPPPPAAVPDERRIDELATQYVGAMPLWPGAVQNGHATPDTMPRLPPGMPPMPPGMPTLPPGMPPMPDGGPPAPPLSDPLAFLRSDTGITPAGGTATSQREPDLSWGIDEKPPSLVEARGFAAAPEVRISALRHPKETTYFTIAAVVGALAWLCLIPIVLMFACVAIPLLMLSLILMWTAKQRYEAEMLGNSVKVSRYQYPEIFEIVESHCRALGLAVPPGVFVVNRNGQVQALARKYLSGKYVELYSDLVDLMLAYGSTNELSSIIGHELGHHAAGHLAWWRRTLVRPIMFIPLVRMLGGAYYRACELTADRIGLHLCGDKDAACRGLIAFACGSKALSPKTSLQAFKDQEREMSWWFAFSHDLHSTHPDEAGTWHLRTRHKSWRVRIRWHPGHLRRCRAAGREAI